MTIRTVAAFAAAGALFAAPAFGCDQWSIAGQNSIEQANGIVVLAEFTQNGAALGGTATYYAKIEGKNTRISGDIAGSVEGTSVKFRVNWQSDSVRNPNCVIEIGCDPSVRWSSTGVYDGKIADEMAARVTNLSLGEVNGTNYDLQAPANKVGWRLGEPAKCIARTPPPPKPEVVAPGMEDNTDRAGGDYRSFPLNARTPEACAAACQAEPGRCSAWTYVRPGVQGDKPICYLKDRVPDPSANSCCISGAPWRPGVPDTGSILAAPPGPDVADTEVVPLPQAPERSVIPRPDSGLLEYIGPGMENNTDRPGSDYARFVLTVPDAKNCQSTCEADKGCAAWTYVRPGVQEKDAICYLKRPAPAPVANKCCISGKKGASPD